MTPDDILALARQGNPKVIAAILNTSTRSHGLHVQVVRRDDCLHILLEGEPVIRQRAMLSFVRVSMDKLRVKPIRQAIIYGRQPGEPTALWKHRIDLHSDPGSRDSEPLSHYESSARPVSQPVPNPLTTQSDTIQTNASQESAVYSAQEQPSDLWDQSQAKDANADGCLMNEDAIAQNQDQNQEFVDYSTATPETGPQFSDQNVDDVEIQQFDDPQGGELEPNSELTSLLRRPEALILLAFVIAVLAWQFYLSLLEEVAPEGSLTTSALARRLQVSRRTIIRHKHQPDFSDWTQQLDPDGIAWFYSEGAFVPKLYSPDQF